MFEIIGTESRPKQNQTLRNVQFRRHIKFDERVQAAAKKIQGLKNLKSPENKTDVLRVSGSLGLYNIFKKSLHVDSKPFYDTLKDDIPFKWTKDLVKFSKTSKTKIVKKLI